MAKGWETLINVSEASRAANTRSRPAAQNAPRGWDALLTVAAPRRSLGGGSRAPGKVDEAWVVDGLVRRGLPEHVAQAFAWNFKDESGLNPGINETAPIVKGSRGGFGLYQLTGHRRRQYEAFAADRGVDAADPDAQLDFLMLELDGPERSAANAILNTRTAGEAGAAIVRKFLRPLESHQNKRAARYLRMGGGAAPAAAPSRPAFTPGRLWLDLENT